MLITLHAYHINPKQFQAPTIVNDVCNNKKPYKHQDKNSWHLIFGKVFYPCMDNLA